MIKNNKLFWIVIITCGLAANSDKVEKVLDFAEKVNDIGSSVPGFSQISQVIGQGLDITRDLVTIFKEVPDPDQDLTVREKYYKDKKVLERYREDYGTIDKISTANMKDFKFLYDEVKNVFKRYGKPNDVLQKEWKSYRDNEVSYIMEVVHQVLQKIKEGINRLENSDVLSNFELSLAAVSNRLYAKQNTILRVVNALQESEESVSEINKSQQYLFNSILQKNKLSINEYVLYNTYNAILDSYSFIETKNKLYLTLKEKLNPIIENLVELQEKNKVLSAQYSKKLTELSNPKLVISKFSFLEESKRFDKKRKVVNKEVAIPFYGWFRAAADPAFRYREVTDNKTKDILFEMNKYIVTGK